MSGTELTTRERLALRIARTRHAGINCHLPHNAPDAYACPHCQTTWTRINGHWLVLDEPDTCPHPGDVLRHGSGEVDCLACGCRLFDVDGPRGALI